MPPSDVADVAASEVFHPKDPPPLPPRDPQMPPEVYHAKDPPPLPPGAVDPVGPPRLPPDFDLDALDGLDAPRDPPQPSEPFSMEIL